MNLSPASMKVAARIVEEVRAVVDPEDPDFLPIVEAETDAPECLRCALRVALLEETEVVGLKVLISKMTMRAQRKEARAKGLRRLALWGMQQLKLKRLDAPDFVAFVRPGKRQLQIDDATEIPTQLCRWVPYPPDHGAIHKVLEAGETIPGASLGEAHDILTVRNT